MDLFDDLEEDKDILNKIEDEKRKTFKSMVNRKRLSEDELDEVFIGM